MRKIFFFLTLLALGLRFAASPAYSEELPKKFPFKKNDSLNEWEEKIFKNRVLYWVNDLPANGYLNAKSDKACSGLIYRMQFWPKQRPMISWSWKVMKFPDKSKAPVEGGWIEKDDYAARVYIIFPSWYFMHTETLEYVWDEKIPKETLQTSPYFDKIKIIVAESGKNKLGEWVFEERNIYEDYRKAFGKKAGRVGAIAIMTDTDNTMSTAEAAYKGLKVGYKNEKWRQQPTQKIFRQ